MEYMKHGSLAEFLKNTPDLSLEQRLQLALDAAKAIAYLHSHNITHRDLKPANLMVGDGMVVKVADFGEAKKTIRTEALVSCVGTEGYAAPEVILGQPYNHKVDSYSFA
jgi:serine/threonine protein kinase